MKICPDHEEKKRKQHDFRKNYKAHNKICSIILVQDMDIKLYNQYIYQLKKHLYKVGFIYMVGTWEIYGCKTSGCGRSTRYAERFFLC